MYSNEFWIEDSYIFIKRLRGGYTYTFIFRYMSQTMSTVTLNFRENLQFKNNYIKYSV